MRGTSVKVVLQDIKKIVREAVGVVAFAVFLHLGEHASQRIRSNAKVPDYFLFHFAKAVQFVEVGIHDVISPFIEDAGNTLPIVGIPCGFPHLLDQQEFFGRDEGQTCFFLQIKQAFQEFPATLDEEWSWSFVAIHATAVTSAVIGITEFQERFSELYEMFHPFVTGGKEPFTGFIPFHDGAGPAAETGVAAGRGAGDVRPLLGHLFDSVGGHFVWKKSNLMSNPLYSTSWYGPILL